MANFANGEKDMEGGGDRSMDERRRSRRASRWESIMEQDYGELDEYTALQKYITTYRDPKEAAAEAEAGKADAADAGKGKAWWAFWRKGGSPHATENDEGVVPADWLIADIKQGLSRDQIEPRRKRFGWNEISTEKENMFLKFLGYFNGPILWGESLNFQLIAVEHAIDVSQSWKLLLCLPSVFAIGLMLVSFVAYCSSTRVLVGTRKSPLRT